MAIEPTILEMIQGEGRWIKFTITRNGTALDMSGASKTFGIKRNRLDPTYVYKVEDAESSKWDVSEAASGIIRVNLPASQTNQMDVASYDAQAKFVLTADTDVDKTPMFTLKITPAVITG